MREDKPALEKGDNAVSHVTIVFSPIELRNKDDNQNAHDDGEILKARIPDNFILGPRHDGTQYFRRRMLQCRHAQHSSPSDSPTLKASLTRLTSFNPSATGSALTK